MVDREHMIASVEAYISSYNRADLDGICAIFAEDAVVEDPVGSPPRTGLAELREFFAIGIAARARLSLDGPVRCTADHAAFPFHVDLDWGGRAMRIDVIDVFQFNAGGKVGKMQAFCGEINTTRLRQD
jgi:steroid Delta-isomerase